MRVTYFKIYAKGLSDQTIPEYNKKPRIKNRDYIKIKRIYTTLKRGVYQLKSSRQNLLY